MEPWQMTILAAAGTAIVAVLLIYAAILKGKIRKNRDFTRKLETVLQKNETVRVICPQRGGNAILTSKRLLFDTREGFTALPLTKIQKLRGMTKEGKTTVSPPKMAKLLIQSDTDYTLTNTGPEFLELAKHLTGQQKRRTASGRKHEA